MFIFSQSKMNANYGEIYGVSNLEADFQQPHVQTSAIFMTLL